MSDKYTWDNAGDLKELFIDQTLGEVIGTIKRQFFHMVTHVFDNSNLSQEIFAIDTWGAVICSLGNGRKHMLTILPTIWSLYSRKNPRTCLRRCFKEDLKTVNISIENISCEISKLVTITKISRSNHIYTT